MSYHGDIRLGDTIDLKFTTRAFASGAPTTLSGTPSVAAYPGNSTTEVTAGITLSVDFDSRTGLNNVRVVASNGNGYATATNYEIVITAGTVGGTSVVGEVVGSFSIENRSAVMPTTAARTLDVSAGGEAGVDWANVGSPTTSLALTGTTIAVTQKVDVDTIKTNPVVNAGTITFPTTATLASTTNITAGTITTATNLTNAATAGDFTATMKTSIGTAVAASAVASVTARVTANTDQLAGQTVTAGAGVTFPASVASPTNITAGTITTATNLTNAPTSGDFTATMKTSIGTAVAASAVASVTGNVGGNVTGSVGSVVGAVGSVTGAVGSVTGNVGGNLTGSVGSLATQAKTDVENATWDAVAASHNTAGTMGNKLNAAGAAADPWATALPGAYGAGTAGFIVGTNLDVAVSTRAAPGAAMILTSGGYNDAADALLGRNVAGGSSAGRIVSEALYVLRNKVDTGAGIVYQVDDTTPAFTFTVTTAPSDPIAVYAPS